MVLRYQKPGKDRLRGAQNAEPTGTDTENRSSVSPIGAPGFEPGTSCSQSRRATGLRHTP